MAVLDRIRVWFYYVFIRGKDKWSEGDQSMIHGSTLSWKRGWGPLIARREQISTKQKEKVTLLYCLSYRLSYSFA